MMRSIPCGCISLIHTMCYWLAFRWVLIKYHEKYPGYEFTFNRLSYISIRLLVTYLVTKISLGLIIYNFFPEQGQFYNENKVTPYISEISEIVLIALVFFIYEGIFYFNKSRVIELEKNKLKKATAEQRLDTLKNQVNPHFLFNSLNTLVTIIPEEPDRAIDFVQNLSKTYRNILEVRDEKLITLKKELVALDSYIHLLKTRFQGKIEIENVLPPEVIEKFILPLSLQILIENAVKHNITSNKKPLKIIISAEEGYFIVKNNLQKKNQQYNSTKMGLANIKSRYKLLVNQDIIIEETEVDFIVKLPIIENLGA